MSTLAFVGDSFVEGVGDEQHGGWTRRIVEQLPPGWHTVHKGIGGDNIRAILNRLYDDVLVHDPQVVVVEVGINDSRIRPSFGNLNEVPSREFEVSLDTLGRILEAGSRKLVLVGLTPVDETRTNPYKEDKIYLNEWIRRYDGLLGEFARSRGAPFVSLYDEFVSRGGPRELTVDGLHPSPAGHTFIAERASGVLSQVLASTK